MTRGRAVLPAAAAAALVAALPEPALAHGIQAKRDLPIPEWLFVWGAALVLLFSFVGLAVLWPKPRLEREEWRPLPRAGRLLASRPVEIACGAIGAFLLGLIVYAGLAGEDADNLVPTFVYVVFWVALVPVSVLFGDVFRAFNPWRAVARAVSWVFRRAGREPEEPYDYPERLGHWPAAAGLLAFVLMELVVEVGADPRPLAIAALVYSAVTWFCMSLYGIDEWLDRGEAFSVYFGLFARLSVLERRGDAVGRRRFLSGLAGLRPIAGTVPLLAVMIGSTSFDGLSVGKLWRDTLAPPLLDALDAIGFGTRAADQIASGIGLLATIGVVLGFYWLGVLGARTAGGDMSARRLAHAFVHSLVPIAVAYVLAHYVSLVLFQIQGVPALLSDPLGRGSDLFGWADWGIDSKWVAAETLWYLQVGFVVAGHVAALALAHDRALALYDRAAVAVRSQYWMLGVMVGFTCLALWLLSETAQG
ncbi:MAG: fenitrothion hydrolase [Actinomycetota bacterium]|nr:fenitrothion hydrolase [Actinomycetota bacterium]